jgi:methionine biosynthesis protein MetW
MGVGRLMGQVAHWIRRLKTVPTAHERRCSYTTPREDIQKRVPERARTILDVGCSDGSLGLALKFKHPGITVIGIENDPALVPLARGRLDKVVCADLNSDEWFDELREARFDCIILADILEHLISPVKVLQLTTKLLHYEGTALLSVPNIRHVSAFWSIYLVGSFPNRSRGIFDDSHLRWFTFRDIKALCEQAGLQIRDVGVNIRLVDRPGGRINEICARVLTPLARVRVVREFFGYQFIISSAKAGLREDGSE